MSEPTPIPAKLWGKFKRVRSECPFFNESYVMLARWCLRRAEFRELGEWLCEYLPPTLWARALEGGFKEAEPESDADVHAKNPDSTKESQSNG